MKKKAYVIVFVMLALTLLLAPYAIAAASYRLCTVAKVETNSGGEVIITLGMINYYGDYVSRAFYVPATQEKLMLAVALTAASSGLQVEALVDFWYDDEITSLRLLGQ